MEYHDSLHNEKELQTKKTVETAYSILLFFHDRELSGELDTASAPRQTFRARTWAQRLKRVFNIDVSVCPKCGGIARVIVCIEEQAVIDKILGHLQAKGALPPPPGLLPATRASPDSDWFA